MSPIDRRMFYHVNWRLVGVLGALFAIGVLNLYSASGVRMLDEKNGVVSGKLVTAVSLSDARKVELKQRLEQQTGKKLELSFATDAEILGGVVLQIGDSVLDASLRAQLNILKETIKRGE